MVSAHLQQRCCFRQWPWRWPERRPGHCRIPVPGQQPEHLRKPPGAACVCLQRLKPNAVRLLQLMAWQCKDRPAHLPQAQGQDTQLISMVWQPWGQLCRRSTRDKPPFMVEHQTHNTAITTAELTISSRCRQGERHDQGCKQVVGGHGDNALCPTSNNKPQEQVECGSKIVLVS